MPPKILHNAVYLRRYLQNTLIIFNSNLIGVSEETLKTHFKEKHKTNTIKPFLLKRNCRICGFDKAPSDSELVKHFENEHPKSDFWADDEEEPDQDEEAYEPVDDSKYESNYRYANIFYLSIFLKSRSKEQQLIICGHHAPLFS